MRDKLESIIDRYNTIEILMADQETLSNPDKLKELAREYKQLEQVVITGSEYIKILDQITAVSYTHLTLPTILLV